MKFRTRTLIFLTLILGLALSACAPLPAQLAASDEPAAPASESVKLGLGFIPSIQFAPYYVGIEKGFFQDAGIELELSYGFENDYLKLVGIDEYQFMVGSGDQVVLGRARGCRCATC
ncbi:MAG: ABC transporter substrate-binding protein [Anaerolineales bacterium]|nr:ABC transporter substrate-binding protein [Anaerolineales bacterium]